MAHYYLLPDAEFGHRPVIGPDTTAGTTQGPLSQVVRLSGAGGIGATMVAGPTHHQVGSAVKVSTQACAKRLTLQPVRQIRMAPRPGQSAVARVAAARRAAAPHHPHVPTCLC